MNDYNEELCLKPEAEVPVIAHYLYGAESILYGDAPVLGSCPACSEISCIILCGQLISRLESDYNFVYLRDKHR